MEEIYSALLGKVARRTLQRRLALLVEQKRLIVQGRARASRYHLPVMLGEANQRQRSQNGEAAEGKNAMETQMILNHKAAIELLRGVFAWAYQRSCARYSAIRQSLGEPDPFRLRYRQQIKKFVAGVVRNFMDKRTAVDWITERSEAEIPADDRARFVEVIETELGCLHEGNFARYQLRSSEFRYWHKTWL